MSKRLVKIIVGSADKANLNLDKLKEAICARWSGVSFSIYVYKQDGGHDALYSTVEHAIHAAALYVLPKTMFLVSGTTSVEFNTTVKDIIRSEHVGCRIRQLNVGRALPNGFSITK